MLRAFHEESSLAPPSPAGLLFLRHRRFAFDAALPLPEHRTLATAEAKLNGWSAGRGIECLSALGLETSERPGFAKMVVQSQSLELLCCLQKLLAYHLVASGVSQGTTFPGHLL